MWLCCGDSSSTITYTAHHALQQNRAVHLYRPAPTVEDLSETAMGMTRSVNLKGYLQSLAQSYSIVYHGQEHADFWYVVVCCMFVCLFACIAGV